MYPVVMLRMYSKLHQGVDKLGILCNASILNDQLNLIVENNNIKLLTSSKKRICLHMLSWEWFPCIDDCLSRRKCVYNNLHDHATLPVNWKQIVRTVVNRYITLAEQGPYFKKVLIGRVKSTYHLSTLESVNIKTRDPLLCRQKEFLSPISIHIWV